MPAAKASASPFASGSSHAPATLCRLISAASGQSSEGAGPSLTETPVASSLTASALNLSESDPGKVIPADSMAMPPQGASRLIRPSSREGAADGAPELTSAERNNALARCTGCQSDCLAKGVVELNINLLPPSPARVPFVRSRPLAKRASVPLKRTRLQQTSELLLRSLCFRALMCLRALPLDESLEQRLFIAIARPVE